MNEFDHRPDAELGELLREALTAPHEAAFVQRVLERIPQLVLGETWGEVLAGWAQPSIAAAIALLAVVTVWLSGRQRMAANRAEDPTLAAAETLSAGTLVASETLPDFRWQLVMGEGRTNR
jgi:hypothetical protein